MVGYFYNQNEGIETMEKMMSKYERQKETEKLQKLKISLYDQRDVAEKMIEFLRQMNCTEDGDKMRKAIVRNCKIRATRINTKITEINDKIFRLNMAEAESLK